MSTNCINCVVKPRTGGDLLCDDCRAVEADRKQRHANIEKAEQDGNRDLWPNAYCLTSERDDAVALYNEAEKQRREQVAALRTLCDKQEKELLALEKSRNAQRELAATHRCRVCGALWIYFSDSWSLASQKCGECCDNQPMDAQIEAIGVYGEMERRWQTLWETSEANVNRWYTRAKLAEDRLSVASDDARRLAAAITDWKSSQGRTRSGDILDDALEAHEKLMKQNNQSPILRP